MIGRPAWTAFAGAVGALLMSACTYPGNPAEFGYKKTAGGDIVIAYPRCPGYTVSGGAAIYARADDEGKIDFKTLWQADRQASKSVEAGVFTVGVPEASRPRSDR
ncbi:hypothetical protein ACWD3I_44990 [Streptomyces sp. NPDC002817]|uniref:hypothetical protein n=1 Tax=Streptomyces sp. NPDC088357 TaxID=3154655 RepID=UPI00344679AB